MTAREDLAQYVALQRLLSQRSALKKEHSTPPEELASLRARFSERREALASAERRRTELQQEQAALQRDTAVMREEREHFRKQKSMVTNMKQLTAVVSELDHVDSQLKAKEDRLLEVWQELEAVDARASGLAEESDEERELREEAEATWQVRRNACEEELAQIDGHFREVRSELSSAAMERFRKLWEGRKPLAVVPMDGTSCSACHAELRPSLVQQVRASETLEFCDSCRRLLFDPEQHPDK